MKMNDMEVTFDTRALNIRVKNSCQVESKKEIATIVKQIVESAEFVNMRRAGYTRKEKSMYREWVAHNVLHRMGYQQERTKDVDINESEPIYRRLCYAILSLF